MKKALSLLLALCLACATCLGPAAALAADKTEIVYANLRSGGDLDSLYVVNRFEAERAESLTDYGAYRQVTNLTDSSPLRMSGDSVTLSVPEGTLFYQGEPVRSTLPWQFQAAYYLDGASMRAEELGGKSGLLEMIISITKGDDRYADFYKHYMLSMTVTLDGNRCRRIVADKATIANSGTDRLLTYTVLPSPDVTYTIRCEVTDFTLADIQINGVPMGMDVEVDTSALTQQVTELQDGVTQLSRGSSRLYSGANSLKGGASELHTGAMTLSEGTASLVAGAGDFSDGLSQVKDGSAELAAASGEIMQVVNAYEQAGAGTGEDMTVSELRQLCRSLLDTVTLMEGLLDAMSGQHAALAGTAQALRDNASALSDGLEAASFADTDIALLTTLLGRASGNADVSSCLAAEISALRRVLSAASAANTRMDDSLELAAQSRLLAGELADALSGLDGDVAEAQTRLAQIRSALTTTLALLDSLEENGASGSDSVLATVFSLLREMDSGIQALDQGIGELQTGFVQLSSGIVSVDAGVGQLAEGSDTLLQGTESLASGAGSLNSGMNELSEGTSNIDTKVEEQLGDAVSSITGGDYEPVSFMDERNSVELVQFVIRIPGIKEAESVVEAAVAEEDERFLDKLQNLFR